MSKFYQKLLLLFIAIPLLHFARAQAPHITSFQPTSAGQGDTVLISGVHFDSLQAVTFGGVPAHFAAALSDSVIWTTVGTGATGKVMVFTRQGIDSLSGFTFIVHTPPPVPQVTSFIPDSARQHDTVLIRGHLFTGATGVSFGGVPALSFHVITDSAIWAVVGNGATGSVTVSHSPYSGSLGGFVFIAPPVTAPHLTSFFPDSARHGDTVSLIGTHLSGVTAVSFGGVSAQSFTILSDSLIWAIVGTGASGSVKVTHSPYSDSLNGFIYIPTTPPSIPQVTSFIPDSARQNDTVLIRGHRFTGATGVSFGGVPALYFHVITDSVLWAVVGNGATGSVTVSHSPYSGSLGGFVFIAPPAAAPHILSFSPDSARQGDTVILRGTHFTGVTAVSFGGVPAQSFTVLSDSLIWSTVGTGASGYVNVIHFPYSDSLNGFIYIPTTPPSIPQVTSFIPDSARQNDTVLIRGHRFTGATGVSFGGVPALYFHVITDSVLWAVVGNGATGSVTVSHSPYSGSLGGFVFIAPPVTSPNLISFFPDSARHGDTVSLVGTHLTGVTAVSFGGVAAQSFTVQSDSLIWAIVGTGASGFVKVTHSPYSDSLGGFKFISSDTTTPPPPPPPSSFRLVSFTGTSASHHVSLYWSVKFDQSIFFYSVEHSTDTVSSHFASIGGIAAQKLDSANYTFTDTATRSGVNYYRLRIVDSVGNTTFSRTFAIDLGNIPGTISLYPNPAIGRIVVTVPATWLPSRFLLADAAGQVVLTVPVSAGVQQVIIPVGRFNKGVYKLMWTNGQNTAIRTILILK